MQKLRLLPESNVLSYGQLVNSFQFSSRNWENERVKTVALQSMRGEEFVYIVKKIDHALNRNLDTTESKDDHNFAI